MHFFFGKSLKITSPIHITPTNCVLFLFAQVSMKRYEICMESKGKDAVLPLKQRGWTISKYWFGKVGVFSKGWGSTHLPTVDGGFLPIPEKEVVIFWFPFSWGRIGPHERVDWNPKLRIDENFFHRLGRLSCEPKNMATNPRDCLVLGWLMFWVMRLLLQCSLAENQKYLDDNQKNPLILEVIGSLAGTPTWSAVQNYTHPVLLTNSNTPLPFLMSCVPFPLYQPLWINWGQSHPSRLFFMFNQILENGARKDAAFTVDQLILKLKVTGSSFWCSKDFAFLHLQPVEKRMVIRTKSIQKPLVHPTRFAVKDLSSLLPLSTYQTQPMLWQTNTAGWKMEL